jgi:MraZ protein
MFRGINSASIDAKGRVALPTRFRELVRLISEGKVVVTIDMREKCLLLYPLSEWEIVQRKLESLPNVGTQARLLQRLLIGHATDVEMDGNGRILLSQMLRDFAELEKRLVLVGQSNKVELWAEAQWAERRDEWLSPDSKVLLSESDEFTGLSV